ncbi:MAG: S1 domain-containing RNA-binding protein [Caldanaerobacter sp.]|uniref:S1 domain-containing RNA-binding protein n=1 Tax=Caldanaerobacter sp. TaxID=2930036 RepID=UPI003C790301
MPFEVGDIVEGTVLNITDFGAFIKLPEGKTGLVHISEVANTYVRDIRDFLKENDKVKVKILSMEPNGKISLSIKKAMPQNAPKQRDFSGQNGRNNNSSFEEKLLKFLKDSDERQQQLRKHLDSKRRNTSYRRSNGY